MVLHPLVKVSPHTVNNTNAFLNNIKDLKLEPDEIMISFDVVSLFTSIPLDTAKRITSELLNNNDTWKSRTNLDKNDILDLLNLCLSTEFSFQNSYYRQISGTPMGSPLSSFLAEAVMQDLEKKSVTNNDNIKSWNRYVDNVFATVKKDKTDDILYEINQTIENIKFTKEEEHNNQLAFLDVLLTRINDGTINTRVYRKKTHTDQILNFNSNHPTQHKISCIRTLFNRIDTHCNTEEARQAERKYLYLTFKKNNYPTNFIDKVLTELSNKQTNEINESQREPEVSNKTITLPYIKSTSEMTARLLRPFNIDVAHKPAHKLRSCFTKHKDKTTTTETRNAIYLISCKDCPQRYVGQTSKKIETRITEHKNAIKRHDLKSLPAVHTYDNSHTFAWTKTELLGRARTKHAREFKEAWFSTDDNTINRHIDIPAVYLQLKTKRKDSINNHINVTNNNLNPPASDTQQSNHSTATIPDNEMQSTMTTHPSTTTHIRSTSKQPIRRSQRIQSLKEQRET
ncbi:uncharacterized protein LOC114538091 [Dendronephthya gigantea]|uniref:uncharacterized protein LOC114538091 n=1 Tax=Dendronephthya gigantea TaxID=151771 RepID=UPI00106D110E|nr:uncharacterized protein LOC114538091 [Dendronephthya gigantea]